MEYVNQNDQSDEQQNCKYDANDEPCGYACGSSVLDNSCINVGSHFGPTNNLCALGKLCTFCSSCAVVGNAVYNPSSVVGCLGGVVVENCIDECLLVNLCIGLCINVCENQGTVCLALNTCKSQTCGSLSDLSEVSCGNTVENLICRNFNYDCIVLNSYSSVGNADLNVSCGHCEGVSTVVNLSNNNCTVCSFNNNNGSKAILIVNCECNSLANLSTLENVYVTVGNDVVNVVVGCTNKVDGTVACKQIFHGQSCQSLVCAIYCPDVAGKLAINCELEACKSCDPIGKSNVFDGVVSCALYCTNIEIESNGGYCIVYTVQADSVTAKLACKVFLIEPVPTGAEQIGGEQSVTVSKDCFNNCICIAFSSLVVLVLAGKFTVYIVVNRVFSQFCEVLNGSSFCRHGDGEFVCLLRNNYAVNLGYVVFITLKSIGLLNGYLNLFICCVPTFDVGGDGSNATGNGCAVVQICVVGINCQHILVNNSNCREVRCVECYETVCGINSYFFTVYIYECLSIGFVQSICERKCDFNTLVNECADFSSYSVKLECEFVRLSTAIFIGSSGSVVESNSFECACSVNKLLQHCVAQGYGLCLAVNSGEYELETHCVELTKELGLHCKGHCGIPAVVEDNLANAIFEYDGEVAFKTVDLDACVGCLVENVIYINSSNFICDNGVENIAPSFCSVDVAEQLIGCVGYFGTECICCTVQVAKVCTDEGTLVNVDGYLLTVDNLTADGGDNFDNVLNLGFFALDVSLNSDILSGHLGNKLTGCNVEPAVKAFNVFVNVNHLGEVNAYGKESVDDNAAVFILERSAVNVLNVNAYVEACGYVRTVSKNHIESFINEVFNLVFAVAYNSYAICYKAENLLDTLFENYLCIKGNALCKYKLGIACIEVHQAIVSDNCAVLGSQQTVSNLNSVCLNKAVNSACVFYLINYCGVEVCERIVGSSCVLEQSLQIEIVTCYFSKLVDNVINSVIKGAVNLCRQTVGNLLTGNFFKLFYKCFECRNVCECIDKVLCFEVIREIITGYFLNIGKKNLCIARCENFIVCLAEECGIYCIENSNDLFESQTFCKRKEIIGICGVNCENLILEGVHCRVLRISHLFEGNAENACKLGGDVDVCNQLTVGNTNSTDLVNQNGKLCSCSANEFYAGFKNKGEVDNLGLFNITVKVGNLKACGEELTAFIDVCKLGESGNEVGNSIQQTCGVQLGHAKVFVTSGNGSTVNLDFGDGGRQRTVDVEQLYKVGVKIEHADQLLENAGLVNNLNQLLSVNLGYESTNVDSLDKSNSINKLSDFAVLNDILCNTLNVECGNKALVILYVINESHVTAGNSSNNVFYTNCLNSSGVINDASNDLVSGNVIVLQFCLQLFFQNSSVENYTVESHIDKLILSEESNCAFVIDQTNQSICIQTHYEIGQFCGILIDQLFSVDVSNSLFEVGLVDVFYNNVDVLDVGLQVHILKQALEAFGIYASEQFVCIEAIKQCFCIDISNNRLDKVDDLFLGNNRKELFLGHNVAEATTCRDALEQSLDVSVLQVGQKCLGINRNRNVGRRYVFLRCLFGFHAQPVFSKRTERHNSQNSYEC